MFTVTASILSLVLVFQLSALPARDLSKQEKPKTKYLFFDIYDEETIQKFLKSYPLETAQAIVKEKNKSFWSGFLKGTVFAVVVTTAVVILSQPRAKGPPMI